MISENTSFHKQFRHVYIEKRVTENMLYKLRTSSILGNIEYTNAVVDIDHYKDVFCRHNQNFASQKENPSLIIAVNDGITLYKGSPYCQSFGYNSFYYCSMALNCIYNCEYCYLQGLYPCSYLVLFVNTEHFTDEVEQVTKNQGAFICASYDTDLLAINSIYPYTSIWLEYAKAHKGNMIEIRTKSNVKLCSDHAVDNVIYAWTLSPDEIIKRYEHRTPILKARLQAALNAVNNGCKVRLCFDPIICTSMSDYQNDLHMYMSFIDNVFSVIKGDSICDCSIGYFRMAGNQLKALRKIQINSELVQYPYEYTDISPSSMLADEIALYLEKYIQQNRIYRQNERE